MSFRNKTVSPSKNGPLEPDFPVAAPKNTNPDLLQEMPVKNYKRLLPPGHGVEIPNSVARGQSVRMPRSGLLTNVENHRRKIEENAVDEAKQFEMDIQQLRMSHKVVVRMSEMANKKDQKISEDKDLNAMEQFS